MMACVRVAVEVKEAQHLPKLIAALKRVAKSSPELQVRGLCPSFVFLFGLVPVVSVPHSIRLPCYPAVIALGASLFRIPWS